MELYERIAVIRKMKGLTQEQLGELVGVSRQAVSKWEAGQAVPDALTIAKLCQELDVSADYILLGKEPEERSAAPMEPDYVPPAECPVCGRTVTGSICSVCGYIVPTTPPKGKTYAVMTTGRWLTSTKEEQTVEENLIKYCGMEPEQAKAARKLIGDYRGVLLRRGLDDRAAQWLASQLNQDVVALKIVEDQGEPEKELLTKPTAMPLPPAAHKDTGISFWGIVLAVIVALIILSFF